jgi:methylthioribulose-1-phosphate dehydratase
MTAPESTTRDTAERLAGIVRGAYARGWTLGTSGNFSAVVAADPLTLLITPSGADKGAMAGEQMVTIDAQGLATDGGSKPSAETNIHLAIVRARGARAISHTHSVWSTLLSDAATVNGGLAIEGYEMLKGLAGITSHEHREIIPIVDNDQDMPRLASIVARVLAEHPSSHGFLLRRHGLYTWGATPAEATRHVEILEFLLESVARAKEAASWQS